MSISIKQNLPLILLLALNLLIGALTFSNYGESWDVNGLSRYADSSLSLYSGLFGEGEVAPDSLQDELRLGHYGPAYVMLVSMIERLTAPQNADGFPPLQHLVSFVAFQAGVVAFYLLCLRWMNRKAAFGAALLFSTQPVLWGHAFINPKDIPFMAFFLLSLAAGFRLADNLQPVPVDKRVALASALFWLIPFIVVFLGSGLVLAWIEDLVRSAAAGGTNIFSLVGPRITTVAPEIYIQKYSSLYIRAGLFYLLFSIPVLLLLACRYARPVCAALVPVLAASLLLGSTVAIRNLGLYAGLLVAAYMIWKHGSRALVHLLFYGTTAAAVVYLLWPYLWVDPIGRLYESIVTMSRYPWSGSVLFNGVSYPPADLPASYLPMLLGIQLTEPVWALFIAGLAVAVAGLKEKRDLLLLVLFWFVLPLIGLIVARTVLYDNFRQILFLLPPVFLMAGVAFEKIKRPLIQTVVILLCALPGIIGILNLHPYEYVYYNSLIGGVQGAFRNFELDYWGISYREAALWLNENAPANANVWSEGPAHLLGKYLREDLKLYSSYESERAGRYDYVVALTRYNFDLTSYPEANVVYRVGRDGAILTVIKEP
ncbi:MAG TPA: hypothetical protein VI524_06445 [Anaerolineales bacterium]|nr:hypothetical protein [Anaerolineales bacterium]